MNAIELRSVSRRYGRFTALERMTLSVAEGAVYGLIGPNGAGKTTTMRIVCTLLAATEGDVFVCGHDVRREPEAVRRLIGYMPDVYGLYGELTVDEYLEFFARCYDLEAPQRQAAIADVLELVDLGSRRSTLVRSLSRGMQQRLSLARSLLHDPAVLVLDEPSSGLDPRARIELRELLRELGRLGKTVLLSSHILADLAEVCTHIAILEKGKLIAEGPLEAMLTRADGGREFVLELVRDAKSPQSFIDQFPELRQVVWTPQESRTVVKAVFDGDDTDLTQLVARLTASGWPLVGIRETKANLEDAFLTATTSGSP